MLGWACAGAGAGQQRGREGPLPRGPVPAGLPGLPVGSPNQSLSTQTHSPCLCQGLTLSKNHPREGNTQERGLRQRKPSHGETRASHLGEVCPPGLPPPQQ